MDIVEGKQSQQKQGEGNNAPMTYARRGFIPVLTQYGETSCFSPLSVGFLSLTNVHIKQVVIMLVIDRENDRALLSRQSRFVPRMWSCLAGFIEVCILEYLYLVFNLKNW